MNANLVFEGESTFASKVTSLIPRPSFLTRRALAKDITRVFVFAQLHATLTEFRVHEKNNQRDIKTERAGGLSGGIQSGISLFFSIARLIKRLNCR